MSYAPFPVFGSLPPTHKLKLIRCQVQSIIIDTTPFRPLTQLGQVHVSNIMTTLHLYDDIRVDPAGTIRTILVRLPAMMVMDEMEMVMLIWRTAINGAI